MRNLTDYGNYGDLSILNALFNRNNTAQPPPAAVEENKPPYSSYHISPDNPFAGNAGFYYMPELFNGALGGNYDTYRNRNFVPGANYLSAGNYVGNGIRNILA